MSTLWKLTNFSLPVLNTKIDTANELTLNTALLPFSALYVHVWTSEIKIIGATSLVVHQVSGDRDGGSPVFLNFVSPNSDLSRILHSGIPAKKVIGVRSFAPVQSILHAMARQHS